MYLSIYLSIYSTNLSVEWSDCTLYQPLPSPLEGGLFSRHVDCDKERWLSLLHSSYRPLQESSTRHLSLAMANISAAFCATYLAQWTSMDYVRYKKYSKLKRRRTAAVHYQC